MKFLLVGLGNRGGMWADIVAAHPAAALCGAVDIDPARRDAFATRHQAVPLFADLETGLRRSGAEAVLLVTPPDGHLAQAEAIAAAGLPLLAEKPLAANLAEAAAIVRLMERAQLPLTVGLNFRYLPVSRAIRDLVAGGTLGRPGFGQFTYQRNRDGLRPGLNRYPLTMRHPMMLEQSIHHLDLLRFAYGREPETVTCRSFNPPWSMYAHDANVACLIGFEGGLEASYFGTWSGGWDALQFEWRTDCADGVIIQRQLFSDLAMARKGDAALTPVQLPDARAFIDDSRALLDAFIDAVAAKGPAPCDGCDHLRSLSLCFAAIEAHETGRTVALPDFHARHGLEMLT
ncbi:MAG: Gfo/Idh/MocA family oxidoreductase [Hyphomicrobiales bacterium]|nr:Gfo/Idh/MocA family oxidoreductase [Hyphomicrobiales bacterium]